MKCVVEKSLGSRYTPDFENLQPGLARLEYLLLRVALNGLRSGRIQLSKRDWSVHVSIDKTLKIQLGLSGSRNVLSRDERIARLIEEDRFAAGRSPFGLPNVRVQKAIAGKKKKKTVEEGAAAPAAAAKGKK